MKRLVIAVFALFGLVATAAADPIGGPGNTDCTNNSCQGSTYTLTNLGQLAEFDPLHELFRIQLSIDTSTYTGSGVAIDAVAIKVASAAAMNFAGSSLFAAPAGTWTLFDTGLNNGNGTCSGGSNGFVCTSESGNGAAVGGTLNWVFDISVANGGLFIDPFEASIKAMYVNANGEKIGAIVSEEITLQPGQHTVPEPGTLLLAALGLLAMRLVRRRP